MLLIPLLDLTGIVLVMSWSQMVEQGIINPA